MSGFTFAIPLGRDDLLVRTERDHYIVEDITPTRHLKSKLQVNIFPPNLGDIIPRIA